MPYIIIDGKSVFAKEFQESRDVQYCDKCERNTYLSFPFTYEGEQKRVCTSCHKVIYSDCDIKIGPMRPNPDNPGNSNTPDKYGGKSKKKSEKARKAGKARKKSLKKIGKKSTKKTGKKY